MSACRNQRGCCSFTVNSVYEEVFKGIQRRGLSLKGHICRIDCGDVEDCNQLEKQPLPLRRGLLKMRKALSRPSVWFVPSGLLYLTWQFNMAPFPLQIRKANPKVTKIQQFSVWGDNTLMMWLWLSKCQQPFFITSGIKFKRFEFSWQRRPNQKFRTDLTNRTGGHLEYGAHLTFLQQSRCYKLYNTTCQQSKNKLVSAGRKIIVKACGSGKNN